MTELFIDGRKVVLPPDLSLKYTEENPFFTKRGKYTLDITLSLLHPDNARIYGHCDRINKGGDVPSGRTAVLVVDGKVYLRGKEVYLNHTESQVSIQLVSGNSELNYVIGENKSLRDLSLGSAQLEPWPEHSPLYQIPDNAILSMDESYPDKEWQLLPFMTEDNDYLIGNAFFMSSYPNGFLPDYNDIIRFCGVRDTRQSSFNVVIRNRRPQPYFCAIIDKVFLALGYEVVSNFIADHEIYKHLYVVHGYDTVEFAKMLPDWTVSEFLKQIELLFDCTVLVDSNTYSVRIMSNATIFEQQIGPSLVVSDIFKSEIDEQPDMTRENKNIGYNLGTSSYYSLAKLSSAIKKIAIQVPSTIGEIPSLVTDDDEDKFKKIFRDNETDTDFIAYNSNGTVIPKRVDHFRDLMNNPEKSDGLDIEIKIVPAPFKSITRTSDLVYAGGVSKSYLLQLPIVENYDPLVIQRPADDKDDFSIQELAAGAETASTTPINSNFRLALFMGRTFVDTVGIPNLEVREKMEPCPICFVEDYPEYYNYSTFTRRFLLSQHPFRFDWIYENIYHRASTVNMASQKAFEIHSHWPFDITSKFVINNRQFLCSKVEVQIDIDGIKALPIGYFCPIE